MLKITKNSGFASFVEIVMTTGIFLITAVGIYSTIAMISPKSASSTRKLEAAYAGKSVIDSLYSRVSAETWNNGTFDVGRQYSTTINNFPVTYNFEIPPEYNIPGIPQEEKPLKINLRVDY